MASVPDRSVFENAYAGKAPWDIGKAQKPFVEVADKIKGSVLDSGCGTGDLALYLAGRAVQSLESTFSKNLSIERSGKPRNRSRQRSFW